MWYPPDHASVSHQLLRRRVSQRVQDNRALASQLGERGFDLFEIVLQGMRNHVKSDARELTHNDRSQPAQQFTRRRSEQMNCVGVVG